MRCTHLNKKGLAVLLAVGMLAGAAPIVPGTGTAKAAVTVKRLSGGTWKTEKNKVYYVDSSGRKATGLVKIGKKKYYFSKNGVQRTGWWKTQGTVFFFRYKNKQDGYMVTKQKVNSIWLTKTGRACLNTGWKQKKAEIMLECSKIVAGCTDSSMSVLQKMRKAYDYERSHYSIGGDQTFHYAKHHDVNYAYGMVKNKRGVCYGWGALYAYLANACGAKKCAFVSSGGHGWAEVDGRVSDPDWEFADRSRSYFNFSYDESGNGRPQYKNNRAYVGWI